MILRIVPILLLLLTIPVFAIYKMLFKEKTRFIKTCLFAPNAILIILLPYLAYNDNCIKSDGAELVAIYLIIAFGIAIPELFFSLSYACFVNRRGEKIKKIGFFFSLATAFAALSVFIISVISCFVTIRTTKYTYVSNDIPSSFDGYKIVHLSDLHLGTFKLYPRALNNIIAKINAEKADLIAFTGDLVNYDSNEINDFRHELSKLKAKDGVVSVMGNHDYLMYVDFQGDSANTKHIRYLQNEQKKAGWRLLLNENICIRRGDDSIYVIGSENDGEKPYPSRGNLSVATRGISKGNFCILLTHDPSQWRRKVLPQTDIQLTLSGHTHAGQIKIFGRSVSEIKYNEWNGIYYKGNRAILVSTGVGEALMPFRFGAWPNIEIVVLKKGNSRE